MRPITSTGTPSKKRSSQSDNRTTPTKKSKPSNQLPISSFFARTGGVTTPTPPSQQQHTNKNDDNDDDDDEDILNSNLLAGLLTKEKPTVTKNATTITNKKKKMTRTRTTMTEATAATITRGHTTGSIFNDHDDMCYADFRESIAGFDQRAEDRRMAEEADKGIALLRQKLLEEESSATERDMNRVADEICEHEKRYADKMNEHGIGIVGHDHNGDNDDDDGDDGTRRTKRNMKELVEDMRKRKVDFNRMNDIKDMGAFFQLWRVVHEYLGWEPKLIGRYGLSDMSSYQKFQNHNLQRPRLVQEEQNRRMSLYARSISDTDNSVVRCSTGDLTDSLSLDRVEKFLEEHDITFDVCCEKNVRTSEAKLLSTGILDDVDTFMDRFTNILMRTTQQDIPNTFLANLVIFLVRRRFISLAHNTHRVRAVFTYVNQLRDEHRKLEAVLFILKSFSAFYLDSLPEDDPVHVLGTIQYFALEILVGDASVPSYAFSMGVLFTALNWSLFGEFTEEADRFRRVLISLWLGSPGDLQLGEDVMKSPFIALNRRMVERLEQKITDMLDKEQESNTQDHMPQFHLLLDRTNMCVSYMVMVHQLLIRQLSQQKTSRNTQFCLGMCTKMYSQARKRLLKINNTTTYGTALWAVLAQLATKDTAFQLDLKKIQL